MRQLHFIPVDLGSPIVHCSVADPFVVIMTAEGVVTMFVLKIDTYMGKTHRLALQKPQISTVSKNMLKSTFKVVFIFQTRPLLAKQNPLQLIHSIYTSDTEQVCAVFNFCLSHVTAIPCDHTLCVPRRERNVHHGKQSELLHQGGQHHQESV